jgi:hypothetical protein
MLMKEKVVSFESLCFDEIIVVAVYDATRIPFNSYA